MNISVVATFSAQALGAAVISILLLGFHRRYARALLRSAVAKLAADEDSDRQIKS